MKAAAFYGKGDVRIEERPIPVPGPNQLVVKINYVGVCGTDVEFYKGGYPPFVKLPMVLSPSSSRHALSALSDARLLQLAPPSSS